MDNSERLPAFALAAPLGKKSNALLVHPTEQKRHVHSAQRVRKRAQGRLHAVGELSATINRGLSNPSDEPLPGGSYSATEREAMLLDDEDRAFAEWAASAEREEEEVIPDDDDALQIESLLGMDGDGGRVGSTLEDDDLILGSGFGDENDDEDRDEVNGDDDDDDDDEEEDAELAARASADDEDDDDIHVNSVSERDASISTSTRLNIGGVETDEEDDVEDEQEVLEPIGGDITSIFEEEPSDVVRGAELEGDEPSPADLEADEDISLFGQESEEEIQSAADILSSRGLLGLGVEGSKRGDSSAVTSFAMSDEKLAKAARGSITREPVEDEVLALDMEDEDEEEEGEPDSEDAEEKDGGLDSYVDSDESDEDGDFGVTSQSSFGRVWELNDDNYVTITEPGESYVYELDEEEAEDQELASVRRGKQGGWSGGLASYKTTKLPEGSKEWVARKAYELLAKTNQTEMFQWTKRHKKPPPVIDEIYPADPPAPPKLPRTRLHFSTPDSTGPTIGTDSSASAAKSASTGSGSLRPKGSSSMQSALERSVNFPCQYKFKVEGGEGNEETFEQSLAEDLEKVLGKPVDHTQFEVEPAGRYKRVIMVVEVQNARQVTEVYDTLRNNPSVKFSFG